MTGGTPHRVHGLLLHLRTVTLPTVHGDFTVDVAQNLFTRNLVLAVGRGDLRGSEPLLARVHSSCITSESYGSCDCDCAEQLDGALAQIAAAGRGCVFYLMQEGRGAGFTAKARDRMIVQASGNTLTTFEAYEQMGLGKDHRVYDEVAAMIRLLGITAPLRLMTNNPDKLASLATEGVTIAGAVPLQRAASAFNVHYLTAKLDSGHALNGDGGAHHAAELPEPVVYFEPYALAGAPYLIHTASYLVPILDRSAGVTVAEPRPHWFRLHAYMDVRGGAERVVLERRRDPDAVPLVRVQRESLLERFPLRGGGESTPMGARKRGWFATVRAIVAHGAGVVAFVPADDDVDATVVRLLVEHVPSHARPLLDDAGAADGLAASLARAGVTVEPAAVLAAP